MTDNVAILDGYTIPMIAEGGDYTLYLLTKPNTDLDSRFKAWDTDEQEYVFLAGWLFTFEEDES